MKKSLIVAGAASLAIAMFAAGCAELENAAKTAMNATKEAQSRLAYQHLRERLRQDNYEEAYKKYQSERAKYQKDNPGQIVADDATLPYMAYLDSAASLAAKNLPERFVNPLDNNNNNRWMNEHFTYKKWNDCIKAAEAVIKTAQKSIKLNNEELKKLQRRAAIIDEATANRKHMFQPYGYRKSEIDKKIQECKEYIAYGEKYISDAQSKIAQARNAMNNAKKFEEETEKNLKNPAFLYPKKNICSSSVPLWRDFKSGMNCLVLRKMKLVNDARTPALVDSISVIGGLYRHEEKIGSVTFVYAREAMTPANTGVLIGLLFNSSNRNMEKALIEKYKKELPGAVITKKTIQKENRIYRNFFTRYVFEHIVKFQKGAKVVQIIRIEHKTVFTDYYSSRSYSYQKQIVDQFYAEYTKNKRESASFLGLLTSQKYFYNCKNAGIAVKIYDEQQMKAYHKFYLKYKKNVETEKSQKQQQNLNF